MHTIQDQLQQVRDDATSALDMRAQSLVDMIASSETLIAQQLTEHAAVLENLDARALQGEAKDATTKMMCDVNLTAFDCPGTSPS